MTAREDCPGFDWDRWSDVVISEQGCVHCGARQRDHAPKRCPMCFGLSGAHGLIHFRHAAGGGGANLPCPAQESPLADT